MTHPMKPRSVLLSLLGLCVSAGLALALAFGPGEAQTSTQRSFFVIATGGTGGTYFPIGQAMAGIVSHPRGVDRCEPVAVCGPPGLIASARTSAGAVANVLAVNSGQVNSALAQTDVVAEALAGTGDFRAAGKQSHVRAIASLFPEDMHLIAAKSARVKSVTDLRGKRVSIGDLSSGTSVTARAVLAAYRLNGKRVKQSQLTSDVAVQQLQAGRLDAFFFVGGTPVPIIRDLIARGKAMLVPIDGAGRKRLLKAVPSLSESTIPARLYPGTEAVETVRVRALWLVNDRVPVDAVYGITRSLFNRANRPLLMASHPSAWWINLEHAAKDTVAPLHPGAARYYREVGLLRK